MTVLPIPSDIVEYLAYDPATGWVLWVGKPGNFVSIGRRAGTVDSSGYRRIKFRGQNYAEHRVVWFLATGEQPPAIIDHRDRDTENNTWANLRPATNSQNGANRGAIKGLKGAFRLRNGRYRAQLCANRKIHWLGDFATEQEAHHAYVAKAAEVFGEFACAA